MGMRAMGRRLIDEGAGLDFAFAQAGLQQSHGKLVGIGFHFADVSQLAAPSSPHAEQEADESAAALRPASDKRVTDAW